MATRHLNIHTPTAVTFIAAIMLVVMCLTGIVRADDIQKQINTLKERLDSVQKDTTDMRETLDILRDEAEQDWLTQERSDQIRSLVQEVLDDADSRSSLVGDGLLGGWSNGFFLASSDGRFRINIGGLIQERYIMNYLRTGLGSLASSDDRWRGGFENTRTRLNLSGHIFDRDTTYLVQTGFGWLDPNALSNSPITRIGARLWESWVKFKMSEQWSAKLGTFMLPFTRESLVSDMYQLAVDRSLIDYRLGLARSTGVEFFWSGEKNRLFFAVSNGSPALRGLNAAFNNPTPPWGALDQDADWALTARAEFLLEGEWSQFKKFTSKPGSERATMLGFAVHAQNKERTGQAGAKQDQVGATADLSMHFDGITFFASGTIHNQTNISPSIPNADWVGYVLQGSTYMTDTTELFMRFEGGGIIQNAMGGDDVHILTSGVNWYLDGQGLKVTSDFGWSFGEISSSMANWMVGWRGSAGRNAEWLFRTQLQLMF